jgi:hypothetical protein
VRNLSCSSSVNDSGKGVSKGSELVWQKGGGGSSGSVDCGGGGSDGGGDSNGGGGGGCNGRSGISSASNSSIFPLSLRSHNLSLKNDIQ